MLNYFDSHLRWSTKSLNCAEVQEIELFYFDVKLWKAKGAANKYFKLDIRIRSFSS